MNYLLDTHILLWALEGNKKKLSSNMWENLINPDNLIFVSVASAWEIQLKTRTGKLVFKENIKEVVKDSSFSWLPIEVDDITVLDTLPSIHSDPFDRILIAQAKRNHLTLMTVDKYILQYPVACLSK